MARYSSIVSALSARITAQMATGNLLAGFRKFEGEPTSNSEGQEDFPNIRQFIPSFSEIDHGPKMVDGTMELKLTVSTLKSLGMVEHFQAIEKVQDALELDDSGQIEPCLNRTTAAPIIFTLKDSFVTDLSYTSEITISAKPKAKNRGNRRG